MGHKKYSLIAGVIFLIIAVLHLLRVIFDVGIVIGSWAVPQWISMVAFVIAGFLAFEGFRLRKKSL